MEARMETEAKSINSYLSVESYMLNRWNSVGRKLEFSARTKKEWQKWRKETTKKLKELTGYDTMIKTNPEPEITEIRIFPTYTRQHVRIFTEPQVIMPFYVLIPRNGTAPYPAVITLHGHGSGGKLSPCGCTEIPQIAESVKLYNYDYAVQLVNEGFIVFAPDARGFGERQEKYARDNILNASCQWINNMAIPLGQTVTGMWTWDLHRLIDYIFTRDDVRQGKIGCAGLSGGGLQTLWASALDERISCAVVSGYLYGYKESLLIMHSNCSCNYVPHLYEYVDMGDIAALIAPRPLLIETGTRDPLNGASGLKNVYSQTAIIEKAYRLLGAMRNFKHDVFEGEHRWNGARAIPWLKKHLI